MFPFSRLLSLLNITLLLVSTAMTASAASFIGLGDLPGGRFASSATGVSADGSVVVGIGRRPGDRLGILEAWRWTAPEGLVGLGDLPGGETRSTASGVSADGAIVVGDAVSDRGIEAYRWDASSGMVGLQQSTAQPGDIFTRAIAISADGSTIVGEGGDGATGPRAFRWHVDTGAESLGDLAGGGSPSIATDVSADGSVVVGYGAVGMSSRSFRWDAISGIVALPILPEWSGDSYATGVSGDGSIVVGYSVSSSSPSLTAFRWDARSGLVPLEGGADGLLDARALGLSADGSLVFGDGVGASGVREAAIWEDDHGWRELDIVLATAGLDLTGWTLTSVGGISADGRVIVGTGRNPNGDLEAWMAVIPEPGSALLLGIGLFGLACKRRAPGSLYETRSSRRRIRGGEIMVDQPADSG